MAIVLDTGPLYAHVDSSDEYHEVSREFLETYPGNLVVPTLVIAETTYFLRRRLGTYAEVQFLADLADGLFVVEPVAPSDWIRIMDLVARYQDLPLGTTDATIVAAAERLGVAEVATFDHRHFRIVRPTHTEAFTLLP